MSEDIKFQHELTIMVFWTKFTRARNKIAPLRASVVATHYIKLFRAGTGRHNVVFMSIVLLVAETITSICEYLLFKLHLRLRIHNFDKNL